MYLTVPEMAAELTRRPGLIPTTIDAVHRRAVWVDWEGYHCYEGFFSDSLAAWSRMRRSDPAKYISSADCFSDPAILSPEIESGCLEPAGFIFHAGRCGSTMLAKSMARSRRHLVFGEAQPHNGIWRVIPEDMGSAAGAYRNLLMLMGRRRLPSYAAHIVKLTSFNIMQYELIRKAFPHVPVLFLFRAPAPILESYRRAAPHWLGRDLGIRKTWGTIEAAVEDFFRAALAIEEPGFRCLDYDSLSANTLLAILRFFHLDPPPTELRLMESEFTWNSKSLVPQIYDASSRPPPGPAPGRLDDLYAQLRRHAPLVEPGRNSVRS